MKKNHELRARVSKAEYEKVLKKAQQAGMALAVFIRYICLHTNVEVIIKNDS